MNTENKTQRRTKLFTPKYRHTLLQLSPRQREILYFVGSYKYLTGSLCAALLKERLDASQLIRGDNLTGQAIKRQMLKLFHHGYLARPRVQVLLRMHEKGSHEMIYTLTQKGRKALEVHTEDVTKGFILPSRENKIPSILHSIMISRLRATLFLATEHNPFIEMDWLQKAEDLRVKVTISPYGRTRRDDIRHLTPDGLAIFTLTNKPQEHNKDFLFIEADRSTMSLKDFREKLVKYENYLKSGAFQRQHSAKGFRVLTVTITPQRRDNLRKLAREFGKAGMFWFACQEHYDPWDADSILEPIWMSGRSDEQLSLFQ